MKNEFGQEEWYSKFYNRMKAMNCIYDSYEEILKVNREALWKEHPMKSHYVEGNLSSTPLRFDLTKDQWSHVKKEKHFKNVSLTRRLGSRYKDAQISKKVIFKANEEGIFKIDVQDIRKYRSQNKIDDVYREIELKLNDSDSNADDMRL